MSRVEIRLAKRNLQTTGDTVLHAELDLELKTNRNSWEQLGFRVDSGTEMTTMPAYDARIRDLPIPKRPVRGLTFRGQEVRAGLLRARVVGMDATEYTCPCYFLGDPGIRPADPKNLLGLMSAFWWAPAGTEAGPTGKWRNLGQWGGPACPPLLNLHQLPDMSRLVIMHHDHGE